MIYFLYNSVQILFFGSQLCFGSTYMYTTKPKLSSRNDHILSCKQDNFLQQFFIEFECNNKNPFLFQNKVTNRVIPLHFINPAAWLHFCSAAESLQSLKEKALIK